MKFVIYYLKNAFEAAIYIYYYKHVMADFARFRAYKE